MMKKGIKPQSRGGAEYTSVRKVSWDSLWHLCYEIKGKLTWDRVDKKTALHVAARI